MKIFCYENGPFMVNTYLVVDEKEKRGFVIDPGQDISALMHRIKENAFIIEGMIATHGHIDHVAGVNRLKNQFQIPFYCNAADEDLLKMIPSQSRMFGVPNTGVPVIDKMLPDEGDLELAGFRMKLLHTPGHSAGSVSIKIGNALFSGDTLFNFSIGRTDLPGGSYGTLIQSIRKKILTLPDDTAVYPGHGPGTTVGTEKRVNPFLNQ